MTRPRSKIEITCQNPECKYFLKEEGKDILKRGKNRAGHQQYYCNHCRSWFVETINTPFYHRHLSMSEVVQICRYLVKKKSVRSIGRITGHHRDTIGRLLAALAHHRGLVEDILLNRMKLRQSEVDDLWTAIYESRRKLK